jgi:putative peptidoglycan lipid II flippase
VKRANRQEEDNERLDPDKFGITENFQVSDIQDGGVSDGGERSFPGSSIARNAMIVGVAFVLSRILGLVREVVIAARFGTSPDYDAYVAAFRVPDLLFLVVMSGAFGSAFIPIFGGMMARRNTVDAWKLASAILSYTLVVLGITSLVVIVFARQLIDWIIAPGLAPEQAELAASLTRLLLLSPLLLGLGAAFKGMLEAQEQFALSAYAPVFYNLAIVLGAVVLAPEFGVYGLAIGVVIGAVLHAASQATGLWRGGMRLTFTLNRNVPGLATVLRLMAPRVVGQAAFQVNFIVMTNFASRIGDNSVSALNYAFQLFMLPYGVLALSLSTVIFPLMARQYETGSIEDMKRTLSNALAPLVFLTLPAAVGLYFFRVSIVQMLFEVGSFDRQSTILVSEALGYFAIGLAGFAVVEAVTRAYYAMQDTKTPVMISVGAVGVNLVLSYLLSGWIGHGGLALAISIAATIEMVLLMAILKQRIGAVARSMWSSVGRTLGATALFMPAAWWMGDLLAAATDPSDGRTIGSYLIFGYGLVTAMTLFFALAYLFGSPEVPAFVRRLPVIGRRISPILAYRYGD